MSYIFRSDKVEIGERVVARRAFRAPDGTTTFSDVIGHVTGLNPLSIRPQEIGGFPSSLESVTIPDEQLHIIKKLSPRRVRNSDIRAIEVATAHAFPGIEHAWTANGQWLMRAGDGITERSNSAVPLGPSAGFEALPLEEILEFYARHGLPGRVLIPERIGKPAERLLTHPDWHAGPEILVMTRDFAALSDAPAPPAAASADAAAGPAPNAAAPTAAAEASADATYRIDIDDQPDDQWLALYHFRGTPLPTHALELLRRDIDGTMGFASLREPDGHTVAIARATLTESGDGRVWLGFSAVEVDPAHRRRGLATRLCLELLDWAQDRGAHGAYLHVIGTNTAGRALYNGLGFIEHHRQICAHHTPKGAGR